MSSLTPRRSWTVAITLTIVAAGTIALGPNPASAGEHGQPRVTELVTYVDGPCFDDVCGLGSAVGPDGALYVPDSTRGRIKRIDPKRGTVSTYADGLPLQILGVIGGGVADIAFHGRTAYVLVNGVNEFWTELAGSSNAPAAEGVHRLDRVGAGRTKATLIADLYPWSEANPPKSPRFFIRAATPTPWSPTGMDSWSRTRTTTGFST